MAKSVRKQVFVDRALQGALVFRTVWYAVACVVLVTLLLLAWRILFGPARPFYAHLDDMWYFFGPALVAAVCVIPIVIMDMARFSNRFAGPVFRLRGAMRRLANGEPVESIQFRDGDFWKSFAEDFNEVARVVEAARNADAGDDALNGEYPARADADALLTR